MEFLLAVPKWNASTVRPHRPDGNPRGDRRGLLLGVAGPILNFMSVQKTLLDLQDGNFVSLGWRIASYIVLFVIGYMLHRVVRTWLDSRRRVRTSRVTFRP